jgi:hypothetical protein
MQCDQLVTVDNCCNPTPCGKPAAWHHPASGLAMCAEHHGNAVKYVVDGSWNVAGKNLPFPEGWEPLEEEAPAPSLIENAEVRPSGLVIETGSLSPSGLVIER